MNVPVSLPTTCCDPADSSNLTACVAINVLQAATMCEEPSGPSHVMYDSNHIEADCMGAYV